MSKNHQPELLVSRNQNLVQSPAIQVELAVCWANQTWTMGEIFFVSGLATEFASELALSSLWAEFQANQLDDCPAAIPDCVTVYDLQPLA